MTFKAPPAGPHGGDGARLAAALHVDAAQILDLSASLNPLAPDPIPVVARHLRATITYPDPVPATVALARTMGVDPARLLLTNGGAEAIALVAAQAPKGWVAEPEFALYRRHLEYVDPTGPTWRSNPHNPSGRLARPDERAGVWDEAFWPLAAGTWTRGDADLHGSTVVGSLTKLLACPGLRIGYVLCPDVDLAASLRRRQPEWSLNGLAAAALPDLLEPVDLPGWASALADLREEMAAILSRAGHPCRPSDANWLLVEGPDLRDRLGQRGIAVRDCGSFGLPGIVRIAVPDPAGLSRLAEAL